MASPLFTTRIPSFQVLKLPPRKVSCRLLTMGRHWVWPYCMHTCMVFFWRFALLSLSVAVLRTTHERKSYTMIVVVSSLIIHTVNNGKAWSMTIMYMHTVRYCWSFWKGAGANIYSTDTQLALRCGCSPQDTSNDTTNIRRATRWLWLLLWSFILIFSTSYQSH